MNTGNGIFKGIYKLVSKSVQPEIDPRKPDPREQTISELKTIADERALRLSEHNSKISAAKDLLAAAETTAAALREEVFRLTQALEAFVLEIEARENSLKDNLQTMYPPGIAVLSEKFTVLLHEMRSMSPQVEHISPAVGKNQSLSNSCDINQRARYLHEALRELEVLKSAPLSIHDIEGRLKNILSALPDIRRVEHRGGRLVLV